MTMDPSIDDGSGHSAWRGEDDPLLYWQGAHCAAYINRLMTPHPFLAPGEPYVPTRKERIVIALLGPVYVLAAWLMGSGEWLNYQADRVREWSRPRRARDVFSTRTRPGVRR